MKFQSIAVNTPEGVEILHADNHPRVPFGRVGVIVMNLGTPDATSYFPMRRYLHEFLSDERVIEYPKWLWAPLLNLIILSSRPFRSGKAYASIWDKDHNDSPLRVITWSQVEKLQAFLDAALPDKTLHVTAAMRYGNPSVDKALTELQNKGCDKILVLPLYPQYAAPTTGTACDRLFDGLKKLRWQPAIRTLPPYYDHPQFIESLAISLENHLKTLDWVPDKIITSYHGMPVRYIKNGDPYQCHCQKTTRLLREKLGLSKEQMIVTFQSRFGPEEWLQPYTDKTIEALAKEGVKNLLVLCPAFSVDCVETLEEIRDEGEEIFHEHGGKNFSVVPCLNDSAEGMKVIEALTLNELQGWL